MRRGMSKIDSDDEFLPGKRFRPGEESQLMNEIEDMLGSESSIIESDQEMDSSEHMMVNSDYKLRQNISKSEFDSEFINLNSKQVESLNSVIKNVRNPLSASFNGTQTIIFKILMPKENYSRNAIVRIEFFLIIDNEITRLDIRHDNHNQQFTEKDENLFITIQAAIPNNFDNKNKNRESNSKVHLGYVYILENESNNIYFETLCFEKNQIRSLNSLLNKKSNKIASRLETTSNYLQASKPTIYNTTIIKEKIDGVVTFGNSIQNEAHLYELNICLVKQILPYDLFEPKNVKLFFETNSDLITILAARESICKSENIKNIFNQQMCEVLKSNVPKFEKIAQNRALNKEEHIHLLKLFYYLSLFDLNLSDISATIFTIINSNHPELLKDLADNFIVNNTNLDLESELKKYLKNQVSELPERYKSSSVSALVVYYHFLKANHPEELQASNEMKKNSFESCYAIVQDPLSALEYFAYHYENLFANEPLLAAAIIYYFISKSDIHLSNILRKISLFSKYTMDILFMYIGLRLCDSYDQFNKKFNEKDTRIQCDIEHLCSLLLRESQETKDVRFIEDLVNKTIKFLKNLTTKFSGEWRLICHVIEVFSILHERLIRFNMTEFVINGAAEEIANRFIMAVSEWLRSEFTENILVNNNLMPRTQREKDERLKAIDNYNNYKPSPPSIPKMMNTRDRRMMRYEMHKFQQPSKQELLRRVSYFGGTEEYKVYATLMSMRSDSNNELLRLLNENLLEKIYPERLKSRVIGESISEVIQFRIRFDFSKYGVSLQEKFMRCVNRCIIQTLVQSRTGEVLNDLFECLKENTTLNQELMNEFIKELLAAKWPKCAAANLHDQLAFALEWPLFIRLHELHQYAIAHHLTQPLNNQQLLTKYSSVLIHFSNVCQNLSTTNKERLKSIKLLDKFLEPAWELFKYLKLASNDLQDHEFKLLVKARMMEIQLFEVYRTNLIKLVGILRKFRANIDFTLLEGQCSYLEKNGDVDAVLKLDQICRSVPFRNIGFDQYQPEIIYFTDIDAVFMTTIEKIISFDRRYCILFDNYFQKSSVKVPEHPNLSLAEHVTFSWKATIMELEKLCNSIESGDIRLLELNFLQEKYFGSEFRKFYEEISHLYTYFGKKLHTMRMEQIKLFDKFRSSHLAAVEIEKIRTELNLENSFEELTDLLSIDSEQFQTWNLLKMDAKIECVVNLLERVNHPKKIECLAAFAKCLDLVEWLRNNATDLSQLKTLVDMLSSESTIESMANNKRTNLAKKLKEAGIAYASLIYDLTPQTNFFDFMGICDTVCSHLESDLNIAKNLIVIKENLQLLQEVHRAKGNVELTSLKRAKSINKWGLYMIGIKRGITNQNALDMNANIFVQMKLVDENHSETQFDMNQLEQLQNVLMLSIPRGQSKEEIADSQAIEQFAKLHGKIIKLANIYSQLIKNGCTFFEVLGFGVYCDRPEDVILGYMDEDTSFPHYIRQESNSSLNLNEMQEFLNKALSEWTQLIISLRDEFRSLNFFDLKQIKYLIPTINKLISSKTWQHFDLKMVRNMLFNVHPNIDVKILKEAYKNLPLKEFLRPDKNRTKVDLKKTWNLFLEEQSACVIGKIGIRSFALLLKEIEKKAKSENLLIRKNREIPGYLININKPNLIVCDPRDQIRVILSLYANSRTEPMPSNDELLFCTNKTTGEEVESFLRLILTTNEESCIYCVANLQELTYEAQATLEKYLHYEERFKKTLNARFALAFVSTTAKPCLIASVLAKYRVSPIEFDEDMLHYYLHDKLIGDFNSQISTSDIDPDKATIRVLTSKRSGNGKSKYVKHLIRNQSNIDHTVVRIKSPEVDVETEIYKFMNSKIEILPENDSKCIHIYHLDIAYEVINNLDWFLLQLIFCSYVKHSSTGYVWRRNQNTDYYIIEITSPSIRYGRKTRSIHSIINYLPKIDFRLPEEYLYHLKNQIGSKRNRQAEELRRQYEKPHHDNLFTKYYKKNKYQRVCFYFRLMHAYKQPNSRESLSQTYNSATPEISEIECLSILLDPDMTRLRNPNWFELRNYVNFANSQLSKLEKLSLVDHIQNFRPFCLKLCLMMADNFGLPSLDVVIDDSSEENTGQNIDIVQLERLQIRDDRRWESLVRPYFIMNADGESLTLIGSYIDRSSKEVMNPFTLRPLIDPDSQIPSFKPLVIEILKQGIPLFDNFNTMQGIKKYWTLCRVMGLSTDLDPDNDELHDNLNYQITVDNALKLVAIYMRFVSNIPVVIMGETGCGKTRLIRFLADLYRDEFGKESRDILIHVKVHGGTTSEEIVKYVEMAEKLAAENVKTCKTPIKITSILFFDEANTTEHVGLIKEIMCDNSINGRKLETHNGMKIIAAVNPYRKHSEEMISKLESAGLGFYTSTSETRDRIGHIPMRHLVYRVQPLPTSLQPLVWDFGQLEENVEKTYITQLARELLPKEKRLTDQPTELNLIIKILGESQLFMRSRKDECSFVSIRDIERCLRVCKWFISKSELIFPRMDTFHPINSNLPAELRNPLIRAFFLSLMVCYHSRLFELEARREFRQHILNQIKYENMSDDWLLDELNRCQTVFIEEIEMNKKNKNIAYNLALLENVFMMIICIELRIPLFIVGKPGSSKSLAKSIVMTAMSGRNSKSALFRELKEAYFINFQCSPLTTSEMIFSAFNEARALQVDSDIEKTVAVVNLDEIGLAEGSESMPLKILHPLLDQSTDEPSDLQVAVIGISNWALDPAKMNRGLFVARGEPDINELVQTARGICAHNPESFSRIEPHLEYIARAYLSLCHLALESHREFYGLRDYYALVKMLSFLCARDHELTWAKIEHSVKRNFGGLDLDVMAPFRESLVSTLKEFLPEDPSSEPISLIQAALKGEYVESSNRYLLFITENSTAIDLIQNYLVNMVGVAEYNIQLIFGSSFRADRQYSEICRNISLIKNSMELGKTVILLNAYNLYESLYDALNQYYYEFAGQKYVHLGLDTHRIKCFVHNSFRLIIIAEKAAVYDSKRFPIPLLNRLEKHFLNSSTMLNSIQLDLVSELNHWIEQFRDSSLTSNEMFIGFNSDTTANLVLNLTRNKPKTFDHDQVFLKAKKNLLQCSTPDCILRVSSKQKFPQNEREFIWKEYFINQRHLALDQLLEYHLSSQNQDNENVQLVQITTHSKSTLLGLNMNDIKQKLIVEFTEICLLKAFDTQNQFIERLKKYFNKNSSLEPTQKSLMLIQIEISQRYDNDLLSCVRHLTVDICKEQKTIGNPFRNAYIVVVVIVPRENIRNVSGFQLGHWTCYHLDELETSDNDFTGGCIRIVPQLINRPLSSLLKSSMEPSSSQQLDLANLFKNLAKSSCSLILDSRLSRTIKRFEIVHELFSSCKPLVYILAERLFRIQQEKEETYIDRDMATSWLWREVANLDRINQYATLRRACGSYLESRLSPLLAYILSQIDAFANLDTLKDALKEECTWKVNIWLKIFGHRELLRISYKDMRNLKNAYSTELNQFICQSEWNGTNNQKPQLYRKSLETPSLNQIESVRPQIPFVWLLIHELSSLRENLINTNKFLSISEYASEISRFFVQRPFYNLLVSIRDEFSQSSFDELILDAYMRDFIMVCCRASYRREIDSAVQLFKREFYAIIKDKSFLNNIKYSLPLVHFVFEGCRIKLETLINLSQFDPRIVELREIDFKSPYVHLDVCIYLIDIYKKEFIFTVTNFNKLFSLLRLLNHQILTLQKIILPTQLDEYDKLQNIQHQYESLCVLRFMLDIFEKLEYFSSQNKLYGDVVFRFCQQIKNEYLRLIGTNQKIDFTTRSTLLDFHSFLIEISEKLSINFNDQEKLVTKINESLNVFYVDVIEALCLGNPWQKPSDEAVEEILKVITNKRIDDGRAFSFELKISTRTLLIQMIFKNYQQDIVVNHLKNWFTNKSFIGRNEIFKNGIEVSIMFVNCVYEQLVQESVELSKEKLVASALYYSTDLLEHITQLKKIFETQKKMGITYDVNDLIIIAKFKFASSMLVKFTHSSEVFETFRDIPLFSQFNERMKELVTNMKDYTFTLANYLIKEFVRKHGSSSLNFIMSNEQLMWITPKSLVGEERYSTDKFILNGPNYLKCKEAIMECYQLKNCNPIIKLLRDTDHENPITPYMCLALYQKCTMLYKNTNQFNTKIGELFKPLLTIQPPGSMQPKFLVDPAFDAPHMQPLLDNDFKNNLRVSHETWQFIDLSTLLIQIKFSIIYTRFSMIRPLRQLLIDPMSVQQKYLPTMPQDNLFDVKQALQRGSSGETIRLYTCSKGHIYSIGNCGRPMVKSHCTHCGEEIGGANHVLIQTNKNIDEQVIDKTMPGYCITEPAERTPDIPQNETRMINTVGFHLERFLINACMYLAIGDHDEHIENVKQIMAHPEANPKEFFWKHMTKDLRLAASSLNLNVDEVILLWHFACKTFIENDSKLYPTGTNLNFDTKDNRTEWEFSFYKFHLSHYFDNPSLSLLEANQMIGKENAKKSEQESQSQVYFMAYELVNIDPAKMHYLYEDESFWKYRPMISFELMVVEFNKSKEDQESYKILKKFSDNYYRLQLIANLSPIVKLVKSIIDQINKTIPKSTAQKYTIKKFFERYLRDWNLEDLNKAVECFQKVWSYTKDKINIYVTNNIVADLRFNEKVEFNMDTKASYFLPTKIGDGLLCYSIIHYLGSIQNDMLESYHKIRHTREDFDLIIHQGIESFENLANLIVFDKSSDLMRIIQSNFSYDSKNLKFIFRYENIEHQLIDRFLRNKPKVNLDTIFLFEFSDELKDTSVFNRLNQVCRQEALPSAENWIEIMSEFSQVTELSDALNTLKIIINYILTTTPSGDLELLTFLRQIFLQESILKYTESILKKTIIQIGKLKYIKHIFITLMLKRAILLTVNHQDPFDGLHSSFKRPIQNDKLPVYFYDPSVLNSIAFVIFQIIHFVLIPASVEDALTYSSNPIRNWLQNLDDINEDLMIYQNVNLPSSFPDKGSNSESATLELRMNSIYEIWKSICEQICK